MKNNFLIILLLMAILFTTIVYAAFSTQLNIEGEAIVRSDQDIRITNISISSTTNGAYETYNNKYNKDATFMYVTLPSNSSITYNVEISDKSNIGFDISQITQESHTNSNVHVDISLNVGDMISANSIKIFTITITNNSSTEQIETLVYKYEFVEHINSYVVETYNSPNSYIFNVPYTGIYKIELWGAQGGFGYDDTTSGATGGYTSGVISLDVKQKLCFYIGQVGNDTQGITTFNNGTASLDGWNGGGATDVRILNGNWNNFDSIKSRIMVAAGGGTEYQSGSAGAAGGLIGYSGGGTSGGTQTTFGLVENSTYTASLFGIANGGCTGGNGYNPGGGAICANGSGGGSSFISGYSGCDAVSSSSTENNIIYTGQPNHYSGKVFTNGVMIDGLGCDWSTGEAANCGANQPQPDGTSSEGYTGNGYARITFLG